MIARIGTSGATFRAMGTEVTVRVEHAAAPDLVAEVRDLFEAWERTLSRFRPDSELSRLNALAGRPVRVGPLLIRVVQAAIAAARATDGVFDPTLGRQLIAAGYAQSFDISSDARFRLSPARPGGDWRELAVDRERSLVTVPRGVTVDLGGIAKGMAVDSAVSLLERAGASNGLVNAGGDMRAFTSGGPGWPVGLSDVAGQFLMLSAGAVATSSTARRRWRLGSEDQHHLIDPRTGAPSTSRIWSASVAAPSCEHAEVAAKAALILGPARGAAFLARLGYSAILSHTDGSTVRVGDWPSQEMAA